MSAVRQYDGAMPVWLTSSRAATVAGVAALVIGSAVILATGSSAAYFGPLLVGAVALGVIVALLMPFDDDVAGRAS